MISFWQWSKRIGLSLLGCIGVLLFGGALYQSIHTKLDKQAYPPLGKMVDIGGYKLHLYSIGAGGPAVILDCGLGSISSDWSLVQSEIGKFTQVVSYDRAGTGWSQPSPFPRTSRQIVQELHTLLLKAEIPKPYILVGHSFGGANVQLYAATYPDEVAGLVLVDSCHEKQLERLPLAPFEDQIKWIQKPNVVACLSAFGITRFLSSLQKAYPSLPESMQKTRSALCYTTKHLRTISQEASLLKESFKQLEEAGAATGKPCFILTAGKEILPALIGASEKQKPEIHAAQLVWNQLQNELATKFTHSHHLIAEKSDHMIPWYEPELIVEAVQELKRELTK